MLRTAQELTDLMVRRLEERGVPEAPVPTYVSPEERFFPPEADEIGEAEGQSFVIEYRDGKGQSSRRRITVWSIKRNGAGIPVLQAICHERNAFRPFRVDRIACCIDYDGEIHDDVTAFMMETFGMSPWKPAEAITTARPPKAPRTPKPPKMPAPRWIDLRNAVKQHATLLSALSHCDGTMCQGEIDAAVGHCIERAQTLAIPMPDDAPDRLAAYMRRLFPTPRAIVEAMETLLVEGVEAQHAFVHSAIVVIDADGHRHPEEVAMINRFAVELVGVPMT